MTPDTGSHDRSEIEPPYLNAESAATRVVGDLRDAVFERGGDIVDGGDRRIPALTGAVAVTERGTKLVRVGSDIEFGWIWSLPAVTNNGEISR